MGQKQGRPSLIATLPQAESVKLRPYQEAAASMLAMHRRALLVAPAGSGKTVIAAAALRMRIEAKVRVRPVKILWLANTREQVAQDEAALSAMLPPGHETRVACVAGFTAERLAELQPDVVVLDEVHHYRTAQSWQALLAGYSGALWGMTATPFNSDDPEGNARLRELVEGNIWTVPREEVANCLAELQVRWLRFEPRPGIAEEIDAAIAEGLARRARFQAIDDRIYSQVAWTTLLKLGITAHDERTNALVGAMEKHAGGREAIAQGRHLDLPGGRAAASGHVRPQAERAGRVRRAASPHRNQRAGP